MIKRLFIFFVSCLCLLSFRSAYSQIQACPVNINFSTGDLTHWFAYTGNNKITAENPTGNGPGAIKQKYDSTTGAPTGTIGVTSIPEYNLPSVAGIHTVTTQGIDPFGNFPTIPTINGYSYNYSILLGSTSITHSTNQSGTAGGYVRGVSYVINVPAGPTSEPYTMTYAYAMVLENGAHNSNNQPLFSATLQTSAGVITCASPSYYLPTLNNANNGGGNATLDSAAAKANGFSVSSKLSPNANPNGNGSNQHLQDVWWKGWTEVTFDLSAYRGQQVTLTFEADNCVPGGHFAYAYIAIRNQCEGLMISGDTVACTNANLMYSVPSLAGATYNWTVPADWVINSGSNTNIISVTPGTQNGQIIAHEVNGCADLKDTIDVQTSPPTIPGNVASDAQVCTGINTTTLTLNNNTGSVVNWIASTDGGNTWDTIAVRSSTYTAQNLTETTLYKALVQNGEACSIDTSSGATISVDAKSVGGNLLPADTSICKDQNVAILLNLYNHLGSVQNWQSSTDSINWVNFIPANTDSVYGVSRINATTFYRTVVKNGTCPADTSSTSSIKYFDVAFPQATADPTSFVICYGNSAELNALITIGTNYSWSNTDSLLSEGDGSIPSTPYSLSAKATPSASTNYILTIQNAGCPNVLIDTFNVAVIPPIIVNAGNDTSIVINEPLQLNGTSNDTTAEVSFDWSPANGLDYTDISNPIATLTENASYVLKVTDGFGCYGLDTINIKVFQTLPDIFLPNAFTPGKNMNNIFRPIAVGVSSLQYFRIYNRWGQLMYSTSQLGQGWDGYYGGKPQDSDTFVWMVEGTSYLGTKIVKKGTMVLIR
ncbi:MAG: gliding motility-associated C-terminal domain-containing protein [Bacteroidetes bacterium]|nr:gliding motility-associated C-terminal domain-containing protein [Bacteroidota bacterium]